MACQKWQNKLFRFKTTKNSSNKAAFDSSRAQSNATVNEILPSSTCFLTRMCQQTWQRSLIYKYFGFLAPILAHIFTRQLWEKVFWTYAGTLPTVLFCLKINMMFNHCLILPMIFIQQKRKICADPESWNFTTFIRCTFSGQERVELDTFWHVSFCRRALKNATL